MSIKKHVRYTLTCDKCRSFYFNGQYEDSKVLVFHARTDGWDISDNGCSQVCVCPDCKREGEVQNEA